MSKKFTPKVLTANDLLSGDVIYWDKCGNWVFDFENALFLNTEELARQTLRLAQNQAKYLIGMYLADAEIDEDLKPRPTHFREYFRAMGPSNYHHGKQAKLQ